MEKGPLIIFSIVNFLFSARSFHDVADIHIKLYFFVFFLLFGLGQNILFLWESIIPIKLGLALPLFVDLLLFELKRFGDGGVDNSRDFKEFVTPEIVGLS